MFNQDNYDTPFSPYGAILNACEKTKDFFIEIHVLIHDIKSSPVREFLEHTFKISVHIEELESKVPYALISVELKMNDGSVTRKISEFDWDKANIFDYDLELCKREFEKIDCRILDALHRQERQLRFREDALRM